MKIEKVVRSGGKVLTVVVLTDNFEGIQYRIFFQQKNGKISIVKFESVGDYHPQTDWIPRRFLNSRLWEQVRGIFAENR